MERMIPCAACSGAFAGNQKEECIMVEITMATVKAWRSAGIKVVIVRAATGRIVVRVS